ncbi:MAG TPA: YcnI family protein [Natronosporangium sp.]
MRTSARLATVAVAAVAVLAIAVPASAHVTVNPNEGVQGERARVDFRVPNESDTESTVGVEVHFPEEAPIASVSVGKVPGWTAEVTYRTLDTPLEGGHGEQITEVVESINWTADNDDAAIGPGEFLEFPVSLGPLPEVEEIAFPTLQTYSDGEVVRWIELPGEGTEPQNPAPVMSLAAADGAADDGNGSAGGEAEEPATDPGSEQAAEDDSDSGSSTGIWLGLAGLVAGLAGLVLGGLAFQRSRG